MASGPISKKRLLKPHPASTPHDHATKVYCQNVDKQRRVKNKLYNLAPKLEMNSTRVTREYKDEQGNVVQKSRRVSKRALTKRSINLFAQLATLNAQKKLKSSFETQGLLDYDEPLSTLPESYRARARGGALVATMTTGAKVKLEEFLASVLQQIYGEALCMLSALDPKMKRQRMPIHVLEAATRSVMAEITGGDAPQMEHVICVPLPQKKKKQQKDDEDAQKVQDVEEAQQEDD